MARPTLRIVHRQSVSLTLREQRLQGFRRAAHTYTFLSAMILAASPLLSQMAFEPAKPVESGHCQLGLASCDSHNHRHLKRLPENTADKIALGHD